MRNPSTFFSDLNSWPLRFLLGALLLVLTGCAGREHYFQPDARVGAAPSGSVDSVIVTAGRHYADHGWLYRLTFGRHYRHLWAQPVVLPILRLPQLPDNLTPTELGGGYQTTSLTLEDRAGHRWVIRTIDKDPYRTLPKILRNTFVLRLVRDETAAANPFAPLVLPMLSRAVGVPHTSPKLYYIAADDSTFDRFTPRLRGKVVLLEEKFSEKATLRPSGLESAVDLLDSDVALRRRFSDPRYQFDALAFARARLFDLWINDWDRHEGQWTWGALEAQSAKDEGRSNSERQPLPTSHSGLRTYYFVPIPKDRDQAFFRFDDGWLTWLASRRFTIRKLRTMHAHFGDVAGLAHNARFIDRRLLAGITKAQFDSLARVMQHQLPDSLIIKAMHQWSSSVYAAEGKRTAALLRARRDLLREAAQAYYSYLTKEPLIVGTDAADQIEIERTIEGNVSVTINSETEDSPQRIPIFRRTFFPDETKKIRIYGLGDKDEFVIRGPRPQHQLPILIFGGEGEDRVTIAKSTSAKGIRVVDTRRGIETPEKPASAGLKRRLAGRGKVRVNAFDREGL